MASEFTVSKTIHLTDMAPDSYRLWAAQTEATFSVHGVWDIVTGERLRPDPPAQPSGNGRPNSRAVVDEVFKWDKQHALARQALLACLPKSELTNVYQLKLASEIWSRLAQEHGAVSTARRAIANRNFYQLLKDPSISVDDHIPTFTARLQDLNYNRDTPLDDEDVNIAFLASLGRPWQTFQQSMGERVKTLKPAMLYAEVRAFELQKDTSTTEPNEKVAYSAHRRVHKGKIGKGFQKEKGNGFNRRKRCNFCKRNGHLISECFKLQWKEQIAGEEEEEEHSGKSKPIQWTPTGEGERPRGKFITWDR
jgi:gag-polypeptide of LTR copia-type